MTPSGWQGEHGSFLGTVKRFRDCGKQQETLCKSLHITLPPYCWNLSAPELVLSKPGGAGVSFHNGLLFYLHWSEGPSGLSMCLAKGFLLQGAEGRWSCLVFLTSHTW